MQSRAGLFDNKDMPEEQQKEIPSYVWKENEPTLFTLSNVCVSYSE